MTTGMLFFRDAGEAQFDSVLPQDSRRLVMVVGVLALGNSHKYIKGEHQYAIAGRGLLTLSRHGVDQTALTRGMGLGALVTEPIWRT